jgi:hypothetical protein
MPVVGINTPLPVGRGSVAVGNPGSVAVGNPGLDAVGNPGSDTVGNPGSDAVGNPGSDAVGNPGLDAVGNPGSDTVGNPGSDAVGNPRLAMSNASFDVAGGPIDTENSDAEVGNAGHVTVDDPAGDVTDVFWRANPRSAVSKVLLVQWGRGGTNEQERH